MPRFAVALLGLATAGRTLHVESVTVEPCVQDVWNAERVPHLTCLFPGRVYRHARPIHAMRRGIYDMLFCDRPSQFPGSPGVSEAYRQGPCRRKNPSCPYWQQSWFAKPAKGSYHFTKRAIYVTLLSNSIFSKSPVQKQSGSLEVVLIELVTVSINLRLHFAWNFIFPVFGSPLFS